MESVVLRAPRRNSQILPPFCAKEALHESIPVLVGLRQLNAKQAKGRARARFIIEISMSYVIERQGIHVLLGKACVCAGFLKR